MTAAIRVFVLGTSVDWPERIEDEIEFRRIRPDAPDPINTVRREAAGDPFALAADGAGIAPALRLAHALLPADRAAHIFLSGRPDGPVTRPDGDPPIPVTYLATGGVPGVFADWRPFAVRLLPANDPGRSARYAVREQLGTLDPGRFTWRPRP